MPSKLDPPPANIRFDNNVDCSSASHLMTESHIKLGILRVDPGITPEPIVELLLPDKLLC